MSDHYPLTTERGNVSLCHNDPMIAWTEDGKGRLFVFLVHEPVYSSSGETTDEDI